MSCSAFISEIVHGPRIPHIVSLTLGVAPAARGGAKRQEGRSGRMRLRRDPRDRGAPAAAPGRPRDRTTGAPRATQAPRHGRFKGERTPNSPLVRKSHAHAHASAGASPIAYTPHATHTQRKRTRPDPLGHETSNQYVL